MGTGQLLFEDYEKAKAILLDYIADRKDVLEIWQYGEVSQPGVSDLDLIAVVKERCDPDIVDYLRKDNFDPLLQDAMAHANLIIVPETTAEGVLYWDDIKITNVKNGRPVNDPKDLNLSFRRSAMLVDWFFERVYRIYSMRKNGISNQQLGLGMMKSFGYCIDNYRMVNPGSDMVVYDALKERITGLRNQWLSFDSIEKEKQISGLFDDFYNFVIKCHRDIFEFLSNSKLYPDFSGSSKDYKFTFPDGLQFSFEDKYSKRDDGVVVLPKKLLSHFFLYTSSGSTLSNILQKSFNEVPLENSRFLFSGEYRDFLQKRIDIASHWYDCLKLNGFSYGLFKFGWYLNQKN